MNDEYVFVGKLREGFRRVKTGSRNNRRCGFVDENGEVVIPLIYSNVHDFHEGMAAVRMGNWANNEWGYINTKGELVIPMKYHRPNHFENGLVRTRIGNDRFYLDKEGNRVIDPTPYFPELTFSGDYSFLSKYLGNGRSKMGMIDKTGRGEMYSEFYADNAGTEGHPDASYVDNSDDLVKFTPAMLSALAEEYQKAMSSRNDIFLIETQVAGTTHRKKIDELEPLLEPEQVCWMVREPNNRYDSNAVAIYYETEKLGYVPAEQNEIIARLMDAGKFFYCKLISKEWVNNWLRLKTEVYMKD